MPLQTSINYVELSTLLLSLIIGVYLIALGVDKRKDRTLSCLGVALVLYVAGKVLSDGAYPLTKGLSSTFTPLSSTQLLPAVLFFLPMMLFGFSLLEPGKKLFSKSTWIICGAVVVAGATTLVAPVNLSLPIYPLIGVLSYCILSSLTGASVLRVGGRYKIFFGSFIVLLITSIADIFLLPTELFTSLHGIMLLIFAAGVTTLYLYSKDPLFVGTSTLGVEYGKINVGSEDQNEDSCSELIKASVLLEGFVERIRTLSKSLITKERENLGSDQTTSLSLIVSQGILQQLLVRDIADIGKFKKGTLSISLSEIDILPIVLSVVDSFQPILLGTKIVLSTECSVENIRVSCNSDRIEQVVGNMINFGILVQEEGKIVVSIEEEAENCTISVTIRGPNVVDRWNAMLARSYSDYEENSLESFYLMCKTLISRLLQLHGRTLEENTVGSDTVVQKFSLPLLSADEISPQEGPLELDEIGTMESIESILTEVPEGGDVTIYLVASNFVYLHIMKGQLSAAGYRVYPFVRGLDCLRQTAKELPSIVVVDSSVRDIEASAMCNNLRDQYSRYELPILLVFGDKILQDSLESITSDTTDFLKHPYEPQELLTRVSALLQQAETNRIYSQFVPKEFLRILGQRSVGDLRLGDQVHQEMTILFVDIRGFTNLSESMTPEENFKFINSYLSQFTPIITKNNGFVDKYIGDAIMALYPDRPEDAIRTAIEMVEHVRVFNKYRSNSGYRAIDIGVGIHTGNLILGIVGDKRRMQGTVISDSVNLASRIQDMTKLYKASVVISQETFIKLENPMEFNFRFLGKVKVKGKDKSVSLFEVFNSDSEDTKELKEKTKADFETAILLFSKREFAEAIKLLQNVLTANPGDESSKLFLNRANKFLTSHAVKAS